MDTGSVVISKSYNTYETNASENRTQWTIDFIHNVRMKEPKDRLVFARESAGYESPTDAARVHKDINVNTLISNENGNRDISRKAAAKYAEAFGVDAGWILYGTEGGNAPIPVSVTDAPLLSWISAGEMASQEAVVDLADYPVVSAVNLPEGDYIALRVDGPSMNKISPPDSVIFVNRKDRRLVANGCYVIADESGRATYKRYRPNDNPPFQPASYDDIDAPTLEGAITVIGRVKRSIIDM